MSCTENEKRKCAQAIKDCRNIYMSRFYMSKVAKHVPLYVNTLYVLNHK